MSNLYCSAPSVAPAQAVAPSAPASLSYGGAVWLAVKAAWVSNCTVRQFVQVLCLLVLVVINDKTGGGQRKLLLGQARAVFRRAAAARAARLAARTVTYES
jgi:hypothetical protein